MIFWNTTLVCWSKTRLQSRSLCRRDAKTIWWISRAWNSLNVVEFEPPNELELSNHILCCLAKQENINRFAITSFGEERANLSAFVCLIDLCLFGFVGFLFLLMSGQVCGLWLWHSLDFFLTFFWLFLSGTTPLTITVHSVFVFLPGDARIDR